MQLEALIWAASRASVTGAPKESLRRLRRTSTCAVLDRAGKRTVIALPLDEDICYVALIERDPDYEGVFYVAVRTTGVVCRSTCPAPKRQPL